ncbi:hypothetical protein E3N88_33485 [Mikania micrantha]|uniref:non-specific serine/threonine protein kinase n=1 Tax=Mikania micrantha TaxID=192012 RepID=A0A5N6MBL0_9ASTR|nr:hypothetical protein E3N88_33485 [Mikania micrantha]
MLNQSDLTFLSKIFSTTIPQILSYNPQITNQDIVAAGSRTNVPFSCACNDQDFLNHRFVYNVSSGPSGNTYSLIAETYFSGLTTVDMLRKFNSYNELSIPSGSQVNVIVNCSCGNSHVSKDYGLFITYPIGIGENLSTIANETGINENLLRGYNPGSNFLNTDLVFVPGRGLSGSATAGVSVGAVAGVFLFAICLYFVFNKRKRVAEGSLLHENGSERVHGAGSNLGRTTNSDPLIGGAPPGVTGITVDKSVEFTYEELANATDNFSTASKIGHGGFGTVYYGELRGEKAAIKKMDMQASKEFLAELKVLTHVHHLNLVRLIGYCVEGSLFLVYEFIGNGNLSQHLRGSSGRSPISWATRVQIALDSARGLEYIHEHTVPMYIHRDIKSPNILIDENFRAKVADFGLTKLTEVGSGSLQSRLVGTFGYMPPEYAQYGEVSPKVDVFAFGVVLFELISAKEAIVKANEFGNESQGLVGLFDEVLNLPDQSEGLRQLVDPRLGNDYPLESIRKVALLARACTHENSHLRPSMRSIVVALMTLSSSTEDWDVGSFYENQDLAQLMSGR